MSDFNRGTGLLVIDVHCSNPNGDPDAEGGPRTLGADQRGLISPVSFKRKLRDLLEKQTGPVWEEADRALNLRTNGGGYKYDILEARGRKREEILAMDSNAFVKKYWDGRVFGNTFLEKQNSDAAEDETKSKNKAKGNKNNEHFICAGAVQFGPGVSIAPIDTEFQTWTNKAGVESGKDRGMAPLAWRFVRHAIYTMPFFVNPLAAFKSGCSARDIDLMKFLIPLAYKATASVARPDVRLVHAWYAEHKTPLGSCADHLVIDAMTPKKGSEPDNPSRSIDEYNIPKTLPDNIRDRLKSFEDLCARDWTVRP